MNIFVGGNLGTDGGWGPKWKVYNKTGEMLNPGPAHTWVLLDEREDSINDSFFDIQMEGYPNLATTTMVDWPASYHNRACGFAFADGHSEIKKWRDARTKLARSRDTSKTSRESSRVGQTTWTSGDSTAWSRRSKASPVGVQQLSSDCVSWRGSPSAGWAGPWGPSPEKRS
jgi:prepilin-type processing-associated H-X9-DG protein